MRQGFDSKVPPGVAWKVVGVQFESTLRTFLPAGVIPRDVFDALAYKIPGHAQQLWTPLSAFLRHFFVSKIIFMVSGLLRSEQTLTTPISHFLELLCCCSTAPPTPRNFVFFYVVVLHLVVFFTLNYWSHSHSANCVGGRGAPTVGFNGIFPDPEPNPF